MKKRKWHSLEKSEIIKLLNSKETGLTKEEANKRLNKYGKNLIEDDYLKDPSIGRDNEIRRLYQILLYQE